ncbi:MAG: hypothetical protein IKW45_08970 [Clostridia bacterium]|nr:hypothetical protein [Clostridia bacterium]
MENNIIEKENIQEETQENTQVVTEEVAQEVNNVTENEKKPVVKDEATKPASYSAFFWLMWLFKIPVIGWIACAVCMFAPKNKSIKNYARATMTWLVVKLTVVFIVVSLIANIVGSFALPSINDALGTQFEDIGELFGVITDVTSGNYSSIIKTMKPVLVENIGEEFEPIIDELAKPDYNELIAQIINGEYEAALADFKAEKYVALKDLLGEDIYDGLIIELQAATNGEPSVFDEIREYIPVLDLESLMSGGMESFGGSESVLAPSVNGSVSGVIVDESVGNSNVQISPDGSVALVDITA